MMKIRGFTLIEIMIVVPIIAALAAMTMPSLRRARMQSNESVAQASLKTIATAEVEYRITNTPYGNLTELGEPVSHPPYIDDSLAAGLKSGYRFVASDLTDFSFHCSAVPVTANVTGVHSFCITEDGVIRVQVTGDAIGDHDACLVLPVAIQ